MGIDKLTESNSPITENIQSGENADRLSRLLQSIKGCNLPQFAAILAVLIGLISICSWAFSMPTFITMFFDGTEMKANVAVCLILAGGALFLNCKKSTKFRLTVSQIFALSILALCFVTICQYLYGWNLGIDEFLFLDHFEKETLNPGRMSLLTAINLMFIGLTLVLLHNDRFQLFVRLVSTLIVVVCFLVLLGYLWNISELVTKVWSTPMPMATAVAIFLLGAGIFGASFPANQRIGKYFSKIESMIFVSFIWAVALMILGTAYTYRTVTEISNSAKWTAHAQQVRTELNQLERALLEVKSEQRGYMLTNDQARKGDYLNAVAQLKMHGNNLAKLGADNPAQVQNIKELEKLIEDRLSNLKEHVVLFENRGEKAVGVAIASDDGIQMEASVRKQIKLIDEVEMGLFANRNVGLSQHRENTFIALMVGLAISIGILIILFILIRREMMARTKAEVLLNQAKEYAEQANHAKDSFLAIMSHEIRTPLAGMLGMLELLSLTPIDREQQATLNAAWDSARGLLRIVNDILDWSKIEEGKMELSPQSTSIEQLLQEVVNTYSRVSSAKSLVLWQHTDSRLSKAHSVDALRLSQVLNNFVSNAIKFTKQGEIEVRAELVSQTIDSDRVCFSVKDTGIGIAKESQELLFQRYRQESADTARMYGGTGLGLAICRRLAELMDGEINLESKSGIGSVFSITLTLPVSTLPAMNVRGQSLEVAQREITPLLEDSFNAPLVLVVDDHPTNRDLLARQIRILGLRAEVSENGKEAFEMWQSGQFAMVITDCHMPEMDGYELSQKIREVETEKNLTRTPIIAWTANVLAEENVHCQKAGMDELLTKPADLNQLKVVLAKWLFFINPNVDQQTKQKMEMNVQNLKPIDLVILNKSVQGRDNQIKVLQTFQEFLRIDHIKLLELLEKGDQVKLESLAHRMRGSCLMVGAQCLTNACADIEKSARNGNLASARKIIPELNEAIKQIEKFCQTFKTQNLIIL